jgi:hypothetical protein
MTDPQPTPIGETLEQVLERVIFEDPATHGLRDEWEQTKQQEQEVYDRVCREEYERRLECHRICQTPNPERIARQEIDLCTILFREELEGRLAVRWSDILRRVQAVLEDKSAQTAEIPDTGDGARTDDNSRT